MFWIKESTLTLCLGLALGAVLVSPPARAAVVTFSGAISIDDAVCNSST